MADIKTGVKTYSINADNLATEQETRARIREAFLVRDSEYIQKILKSDLQKYLDNADISRMKLITLDFFVPAFLSKICLVYDQEPSIKTGNEKADKKLRQLLKSVKINRVFYDILTRMKLNNTVIAYVKYNSRTEKIIVDASANQNNSIVYPYEDFILDFPAIALKWYGNDGKEKYTIWDRENKEHYFLEDRPEYDSAAMIFKNKNKIPIGGNDNTKAPGYWPFVIYRDSVTASDFWGFGFDSLIEIVRVVNLLLTISADDTLQEAIRILILNFNPTGTEGESGQLKAGLRHPFYIEDGIGDKEPTGEILKADLYNDEMLKLVSSLSGMLASLHNIPDVLKSEISEKLSGIALKIKNEPLIARWRKDINAIRETDIELIKTIVAVHNYYTDRAADKIDSSVLSDLEIEYKEPSFVYDEVEEYELEREKWADGTSSPVLWVMKKKRLSRDEAIKFIEQNIKDSEMFASIGSVSVPVKSAREVINEN